MGGGGGGARTPYVAADNLQSAQIIKIVDLIGEGPLAETTLDLSRVYLNDTPVISKSGTENFKGVSIVANRGTADQAPLKGFNISMNSRQVGTEITHSSPVVRTVNDIDVNGLIVTLGVGQLLSQTNEGDVNTTSVELLVELVKDGKVVDSEQGRIEGKTTSGFNTDIPFYYVPEPPFDIRVKRLTADSTSSNLQNKTYFSSYTEVTEANMRYPYSAVVGLDLDSKQFGNSVPSRKYLTKGLILRVPSNYDPVTRTYDPPVWDGTFKSAWTDNPAWVYYDLLTNKRYGLGKYLGSADVIDKWSLYRIAQYCDEMVDDGYGGKEPRVTCNVVLFNQREAYDVLSDLASVFRGITLWTGTTATIAQDRQEDPVALFTNSNVVGGEFQRAFTAKSSIPSIVYVEYLDKRDFYAAKVEYVVDEELLQRYGKTVKKIMAFGCTSRGQAQRYGRWILETAKRETNTITFTVGAEGLVCLPYDVIQVADKHYSDEIIGCRVVSVNHDERTVELDDVSDKALGGFLMWLDQDGLATKSEILSVDDKVIRLKDSTNGLEVDAVCTVQLNNNVTPQLYRVITVEEVSESGTYNITAVRHSRDKHEVIDNISRFTYGAESSFDYSAEVFNLNLNVRGRDLEVSWEVETRTPIQHYEVTLYKNGKPEREPLFIKESKTSFTNLSQGDYEIEVRAVAEGGKVSEPIRQGFSITYEVTALRTTPLLWGIRVNWQVPEIVLNHVVTELWYSKNEDFSESKLLSTIPYPQSEYLLTNVGLNERYYFKARIVDENGNAGEFTDVVMGMPDTNTEKVAQALEGKLTETAFAQSMLNKLNESNRISAEMQQKLQALSIGGRNYIRNSGLIFPFGKGGLVNILTDKQEKSVTILPANQNIKRGSAWFWFNPNTERGGNVELENGQEYTISGIIHEAKNITNLKIWFGMLDGNSVRTTFGVPIQLKDVVGKFSHTFTYTGPTTSVAAPFFYANNFGADSRIKFSKIKLEKGNVATDWTPAPEDLGLTQSDLDRVQNLIDARVEETENTVSQLGQAVSAMKTIKTVASVGGKQVVTGLVMGSDGTTGESSLIIQADKFALVSNPNDADGEQLKPFMVITENGKSKIVINGDTIANGTILGSHIAANQVIEAPTINGSVINGGEINIGNGNFRVTSDGQLYAKGGTFEGTVYADKIIGDVIKVVTFEVGDKPDRVFADIEPSDKFRVLNLAYLSYRELINKDNSQLRNRVLPVLIKVNGYTCGNIGLRRLENSAYDRVTHITDYSVTYGGRNVDIPEYHNVKYLTAPVAFDYVPDISSGKPILLIPPKQRVKLELVTPRNLTLHNIFNLSKSLSLIFNAPEDSLMIYDYYKPYVWVNIEVHSAGLPYNKEWSNGTTNSVTTDAEFKTYSTNGLVRGVKILHEGHTDSSSAEYNFRYFPRGFRRETLFGNILVRDNAGTYGTKQGANASTHIFGYDDVVTLRSFNYLIKAAVLMPLIEVIEGDYTLNPDQSYNGMTVEETNRFKQLYSSYRRFFSTNPNNLPPEPQRTKFVEYVLLRNLKDNAYTVEDFNLSDSANISADYLYFPYEVLDYKYSGVNKTIGDVLGLYFEQTTYFDDDPYDGGGLVTSVEYDLRDKPNQYDDAYPYWDNGRYHYRYEGERPYPHGYTPNYTELNDLKAFNPVVTTLYNKSPSKTVSRIQKQAIESRLTTLKQELGDLVTGAESKAEAKKALTDFIERTTEKNIKLDRVPRFD